MMKLKIVMILSCLAIILVACGGESDATDLPQLPTSAVDAQNTADALGVQAEEVATDANVPTSDVLPTNTRVARPTLPPTFTPTIAPTLTPTLVPTATNTLEVRDAVSDACSSFGPDFALITRTFNVGQSPVAAWTAVEGAALYRIYVYDENRTQLNIDPLFTEETNFSLPSDLFAQSGRYSWDVEPLDGAGIQICLGRGEGFVAN